MEKEKYYTPSIEEFHVGFEYEEFNREKWIKTSIEDNKQLSWFMDDSNMIFGLGYIRVKYLDRKDIESFGFKNNDTVCFRKERLLFGNAFVCYYKEYQHLYYFIECLDEIYGDFGYKNRFIISVFNKEGMKIDESTHHLFNGTIKNKSELSRLLKQLSII